MKVSMHLEMRHDKSTLAFYLFVTAGILGLSSDLALGGWMGWKDAHTLSHYCFGFGFPLYWVAIFSIRRKANRKAWQVAFDHKVVRHFGDGFWIGATITACYSLWNEVIVYQVYNPAHPADWHHWIADQAGIMTAYAILKAGMNRSAAT